MIVEEANMYYVYVLQSLVDDKFYTGYTKNLRKRIEQHQIGEVASTQNRIQFNLVYYSPREMLQRSNH